MSDLDESPAVPPEDRGGDERIGYRIGGLLLLVLGWGLAVGVNIALHRLAPAAGQALGPWRIYPALGPYAWGAVALGLIGGVVGIVMLWLAQRAARGNFVLPGYSY